MASNGSVIDHAEALAIAEESIEVWEPGMPGKPKLNVNKQEES